MELRSAIQRFSALGNETRLRAFRMLVKAGPAGLAAGAIARALDVPPSTLTSHLGRLVSSGLAQSWRAERNVFYAIKVEDVRDIVAYLTDDCCQGQPELCGFADQDAKPENNERDQA